MDEKFPPEEAPERKNWLQLLIGVGLSGGLLAWLIYAIEWRLVAQQLAQVNYLVFFPFIAGFAIQMWLRGLRWRYLLPEPTQPVTTRLLFDGVLLGNFVNYILPLRLGEIARPLFLKRHSSHSFSSSLVSVVIERFFDLAFVLISFGIMSFYLKDIPSWIQRGATIFAILSLGIFVFIWLGSWLPERLMQVFGFFLRPLPEKISLPLHRSLEDFLQGAKVVGQKHNLLMLLGFSFVLWLVTFLQYYGMLFMFRGLAFTFWHGVALTVIIALSVAAPSAPGFIGVFQISCIAAFALFGWDKERATTYAILTHALQYLLILLYGTYLLFRYNLNIRDLRRSTTSPENTTQT